MNNIFTNNDYNSNDGMLTYIWGPSLWHSLHTISFNFPVKPSKEDKSNYLLFFTSLQNILPCKYCRDNYTKNLGILPLTIKILKNRKSFSLWLYNMHELINTDLNKKSNLTYNDIKDRYEHFRSRCLIDPTTKYIKEKGCTTPLHGIKSKCILNIVPKDLKIETFKIDKKCKLSRN